MKNPRTLILVCMIVSMMIGCTPIRPDAEPTVTIAPSETVAPTLVSTQAPSLTPSATLTPSPTIAPYLTPTEITLPTIESTSLPDDGSIFASSECGFRIAFPAGWQVVDNSSDEWYAQDSRVGNCVFGLRPDDWGKIQRESDVYLGGAPVTIIVASAPPESISQLVFIEKEDGVWYILGRQGYMMEANISYLNGNLLVEGIGAFGAISKQGASYAGLGIAWRALLWDGQTRTALFEDDYDDEAFFLKLLSGFSFE